MIQFCFWECGLFLSVVQRIVGRGGVVRRFLCESGCYVRPYGTLMGRTGGCKGTF